MKIVNEREVYDEDTLIYLQKNLILYDTRVFEEEKEDIYSNLLNVISMKMPKITYQGAIQTATPYLIIEWFERSIDKKDTIYISKTMNACVEFMVSGKANALLIKMKFARGK